MNLRLLQMRQNAPIGSIYLDVARDKATRIGWRPAEFREFANRVTSIDQMEEMIPGTKRAIEECLVAIAAILQRKNLMVGEFNHRVVMDPMLYSSKRELLKEMRSTAGLGELRIILNRISDRDRTSFGRSVLRYGDICCKEDISAAFYAIMVAVADANAVA